MGAPANQPGSGHSFASVYYPTGGPAGAPRHLGVVRGAGVGERTVVELGNAIFGHSRGQVPVKRSCGLEEHLQRLFETYSTEDEWTRSYGPEFESNVFEVHPYYWGDCSCGYAEKETAWSETNTHRAECYQTVFDGRVEAFKKSIGYSDDFPVWRKETEQAEPGMVIVSWIPRDDESTQRYRAL